MLRPRIGIPVPTSFDIEYNNKCWPEYEQAVIDAGGEAVGVPLDLSDADLNVVMHGCDAYLLPGSGADVAPERYGQTREPECNDADPKRERVDWALLRDAEESGKPLFCICFGTQSLNVYRGGTLVQHLNPIPVNHRAGRAVASAHIAAVSPESLTGQLTDRSEATERDNFLRLPINSSHHQAIGIPGEGLRVTARSVEDGVIEAVETDPGKPFLLALQWHPERTIETSATSRAIFQRFVEEAAKAAAKAQTPSAE